MKILQIKNKDCPDISKPTEQFDKWFLNTFGEKIEWKQMGVDIPLDFKDFGVWGGKTLRGLKWIKEQLRGIVNSGNDIVQFFYDPRDEKDLANWTYPNPLTSNDVFCEFPIKQFMVDSGNTFEVLKHETTHALFRMLNRKGVYVYETIDNGGTIEDNIKTLLLYKDKIFSKDSFLVSLQKKLIELLTIKKTRLEKRNLFWAMALNSIGKDMSPTQKELGCAESVNNIYKLAFGSEIGGGASTYLLWKALQKRKDFEQCDYEIGAIIISPTGTQRSSSIIKNGHTGIVGSKSIISNNSKTGLVDTHLTLSDWETRYKDFPIMYYHII